jgi:hypothetical protein
MKRDSDFRRSTGSGLSKAYSKQISHTNIRRLGSSNRSDSIMTSDQDDCSIKYFGNESDSSSVIYDQNRQPNLSTTTSETDMK